MNPLRSWLLVRLAWLAVTLVGITFITFLVLDRSPIDRAVIEAERAMTTGSFVDRSARDAAIQQLRVRYGMLDPETLEPRPVWRRYSAWLGNATALHLAGPGDDDRAFWRRLFDALPVTALLGGLALGLALAAGLPLGAWLGRRRGARPERLLSTALLVGAGLPEFLLATLLQLALGVAWLRWFPTSGLRSEGAEQWTFPWQVLDFVHHLALPVLVLTLAPFVLVTRFVRDAVSRAAASPFAANLRALGIEPGTVRRRLLRHGAAPVATLMGSLLPMLVGGSIVVENLFALDGLGHLAFVAVMGQDQAMVMALVLLTSVVTLLSLLVSDLLHRAVDPRVMLR